MSYIPRSQRPGYLYLMQKDIGVTRQIIRSLEIRVVDFETFKEPTKIDSHKYFGWMRFRSPLPDWDAMEGGLVPLFNCYKADTT